MSDQAESLRRLTGGALPAAAAAVDGAPIVAVTGGRAGVGATTVAVNLGAVLADAGRRVLVVDAAASSNMAAASGLRGSRVERTLADVLARSCSAAEALVEGPCGALLLANRGSWRAAEHARRQQQVLFAELESLRGELDLLIVDLGSGLSAWSRRFWLQARLVLLVTTPDSGVLMDSYATMKRSVADGLGPEVRLVMNQTENERLASEAQRRFSESCRRFLWRSVTALPTLPKCDGMHSLPRVWEEPNTAFGHAVLWLGRAVSDELTPKEYDDDWCATACGASNVLDVAGSTARR